METHRPNKSVIEKKSIKIKKVKPVEKVLKNNKSDFGNTTDSKVDKEERANNFIGPQTGSVPTVDALWEQGSLD